MLKKFSEAQDNIGFSSSLSALKSDLANMPLLDSWLSCYFGENSQITCQSIVPSSPLPFTLYPLSISLAYHHNC
jgi:hypothetical protein